MNASHCSRGGLAQCVPVVCSIFLFAGGCSPGDANRPEVIRPVKTMVVAAGGDTHVRVFPGKVEASRRAELAFQVPGLIVELPVKEGQRVAKGEVIAQLRPDEFQARLKALQGQLDQSRAALQALRAGERPEQIIRLESNVRAAEARLANARIEYDRSRRLIRTVAISRAGFDRDQTNFRVAQEEHQAAIQLLQKGRVAREEDVEAQEAVVRGLEARVVEANLQVEDATLRAPYDGVIAQRLVDENRNIQAKEPVVRFQDVDEIEVLVDVPESIMAADIRSADIVELVAEFSGARGVEFPVRVSEVAKAADPVTQTFQVRVAMKSPPEVKLLPGMTARVTLTFRRANVLGGRILVPVSAVSQNGSEEQVVWVVGADETVSCRAVQFGEATGGEIEIIEGLEPGERIAVAGVTFLREGMKVRDLGDALGGGQP